MMCVITLWANLIKVSSVKHFYGNVLVCGARGKMCEHWFEMVVSETVIQSNLTSNM